MNEHEEILREESEAPSADQMNKEPDMSPAAEVINKLHEEKDQLFHRLQRLQADFDNYRKRVKAERQEWSAQVIFDLIRELLPVVDNLERAKAAHGSPDNLSQGVDLVYRQLVDILQKRGLSVIAACGSEFDPNCHHAIMQVECDLPENTVVEELQKGYRLGDRVLRPSMVNVAK